MQFYLVPPQNYSTAILSGRILSYFRLSKKSGESLVLQSESPPCEGGWRGVSLVGTVVRCYLLSACGGDLNPSVCCADSSPRRGAKLPATSPYRIHDRAERIESSDTAPIRAAPACLQKSLFRQAAPKQSGGLFWRGEPSPGVPRCEAQIPQFSVKRKISLLNAFWNFPVGCGRIK